MTTAKTAPFTLALLFSAASLAAAPSMVGDVGTREARVWVAAGSAKGITAACSEGGKAASSAAVQNPQNGGASTIIFSGLNPGAKYEFSVKTADGAEIAKGSFKTRPDYKDRTPPPDFSFAVFGENYLNDKQFDPPYKTPGGEYEIYAAADAKNPAFSIWADGMNTLRNADEDSASAKFLRGAAAREIPEISALLSKRANYGVAARGSYYGKSNDSNSAGAVGASAAFDMLWANPASGAGGAKSYSFQYADAEFFVLDDCSNRSYLDYRNSRPAYLGERQLEWLMGALQNSKANFKFVVMSSPFANPANSRDNFAFSADERKRLSEFLVFSKIPGIVFLSANKPFGELSRLVRAGGYPIYDLTAGPLTGRPIEEVTEMNYFRVPSSAITKRSFAIIKVDGPENDRAVTFSFFDSKGAQLFSTTVKLSELKKFD